MTQAKVVSGEIDFYIPAIEKACKTWYTVHGDIKARRPSVPTAGPAQGMPT
jgi:hypothetical protein